jgi:hypothetical protein
MTGRGSEGDGTLGEAIRSSLVAQTDTVDVPAAEVHARVAAARRKSEPGIRRPTGLIAAAAIVVVAGAVALSRVAPNGTAVPPTSTRSVGTPSAVSSSGPNANTGRDRSGIPTVLAGEPVHIGLAGIVFADSTTDASAFLLGGWFPDASVFTCSGGLDRDPSPLLAGCATVVGGDGPFGMASPHGRMYWGSHSLPGGRGPSIVRVHTHDPRAAACRPENRTSCSDVLVVDDVLWTGDDWTAVGPLSVSAALKVPSIETSFPMGPNGSLAVTRSLFATALPEACPSPWPHETFRLRGDPRFDVVAVFPDESSRANAQAALDPSAPGCGVDARVTRIGSPRWVGVKNALFLVYGDEAATGVEAAFGLGSGNPDRYLPLPPPSLDESYRVVDDAEAARAAGFEDFVETALDASSDWSSALRETIRRFNAKALTYAIGPGRAVTAADVPATTWATLQKAAVRGTARMFVVEHPDSTDPALASETLVAFELLSPMLDTWAFLAVPPTP